MQSYGNLEHIIIDGQSTDRTYEMVIRHRKKLAHCLSEPDSGLYDAMNKGLRLASGDYVFFLNAGDVFNGPDTVASIFQSDLDFAKPVYGYVQINTGSASWYSPYEGADFVPSESYLPHHQSIFYPKAYYEHNSFDLRFPTQADIIFTHHASVEMEAQFVPVLTVKSGLGGFSTHLFKSRIRVNALIDELSEIAAIRTGRRGGGKRLRIAAGLNTKYVIQKFFGDWGLFQLVRWNAKLSAINRLRFEKPHE